MLFPIIRCFRSLSVLHHLAIFVSSVAISVSFEIVKGWQATGFCLSCVNLWQLALYVVWYFFAMVVIASVTRQDRIRVEARIDREVLELTDSISQLREEHQGDITGIQDRVGDLRDWVGHIDRAMRDELGVDLPPPTVSVRATFRSGAPTMSVNATTSGPVGRRAQLLFQAKRHALNLRRWIWRIFVDWGESPRA